MRCSLQNLFRFLESLLLTLLSISVVKFVRSFKCLKINIYPTLKDNEIVMNLLSDLAIRGIINLLSKLCKLLQCTVKNCFSMKNCFLKADFKLCTCGKVGEFFDALLYQCK